MNDIQYYKDFLEGQLTGESEQEFADKFAYDQSFRNGFRSYTTISTTVSSNVSKFGPSAAVTSDIFSTLGMTGIAAAAVAQPVKYAFLKTKLFSSLAAAAVASILTILFTFNSGLDDKFIQTDNMQTNIITDHVIPTAAPMTNNKVLESDQVAGNNLPKRSNFKIQNTAHSLNRPISPIIADENTQNSIQEPTVQELDVQIMDNITVSDEAETIAVVNDVIIPEQTVQASKPRPDSNSNLRIHLGLRLRISSSASWNLPEETIYPSRIAKLHNMNASLSYELSDNWVVGLSVRQETFFVRYSGTDDNQRPSSYEQQPNLLSYGADLRWTPGKTMSIDPYFGVSLNMNSYGPVARGAVGGTYYLYPEFGITCELEYSKLYFKHQEIRFSADKIGINYGILFCF